jgi:NADH-quinone oxidoreductase subunit C
MAQVVLERLRRKFGDAILETNTALGNECAVVAREKLVEIAAFLRDDRELAFDMPIDNTAVDWFQKRPPQARFDVVWHVYSTTKHHRLRLKVRVGEEDPTVPSLTPTWRGMNWHERETWDLYGIRFTAHPNLKRILLYEEFVGHPLRKDYPIDRRQPLIPLRKVRDVPTQRNPPPTRLNQP